VLVTRDNECDNRFLTIAMILGTNSALTTTDTVVDLGQRVLWETSAKGLA
jgi:hypothetical protein